MRTLRYPCLFLFLLGFFLSACGGGGGSDTSSNNPPNPQPPTPPKPTWIDAGTLGNSILVLSETTAGGQQLIEKFAEDGQVSTLTPEMVSGGKIAFIGVSPDGKKIAYLADQQTDNLYELFIMNADGSFNSKISHTITNGDITQVFWSKDSNHLIYIHKVDGTYTSYITSFSGNPREISYENGSIFTDRVNFIDDGEKFIFFAKNGTELHYITVNSATGNILNDITLPESIIAAAVSYDGQYLSELIENEIGEEQIRIYNTNTDSFQAANEATQNTTIISWSPTSAEIAIFNFNEFVIHNSESATSTTITDFDGLVIDSISWNELWHSNGKYLVFQTGGDIDDLFIISTDGSTETQVQSLLSLDSSIRHYQISNNDKLIALTQENEMYALNLDGTNIQDFSHIPITGNIRALAWLPNNEDVAIMHYNIDSERYIIRKVNLQTSTTKNITEDRSIFCFVVADKSKSSCNLFFDER